MAEQYAHLVATRILTPRKIMNEILYGRAADKVFDTIRRAVGQAVEKSVEFVKPVVFLTLGNEKYEDIKRFIIGKLTRIVPRTAKNLEGYMERAMDLERTMANRMKALTPEEFETVLRSAFQEDEWLLILVGAILGGLVGLGQALFMIA
ncbi:MAG: hypothetical protein D6767_09865 [Candidatus Hydrogenedentota bacterium]|nr:MAG: hypothetical protein D6767_09865 [Candidatus Hydrogenedentota bacterium]